MELMQVIIKPYLTEKTFSVRSKSAKEVIAFIINPKANKNDVKKAFEMIYEIKPETVNTITKKPVAIRTGTRQPGFSKLTKIAYVTLPAGVKLAVTKEEIETAQEEIKKEKVTKTTSDSGLKKTEVKKEKTSTSKEK